MYLKVYSKYHHNKYMGHLYRYKLGNEKLVVQYHYMSDNQHKVILPYHRSDYTLFLQLHCLYNCYIYHRISVHFLDMPHYHKNYIQYSNR